jgi:hypothetical protein
MFQSVISKPTPEGVIFQPDFVGVLDPSLTVESEDTYGAVRFLRHYIAYDARTVFNLAGSDEDQSLAATDQVLEPVGAVSEFIYPNMTVFLPWVKGKPRFNRSNEAKVEVKHKAKGALRLPFYEKRRNFARNNMGRKVLKEVTQLVYEGKI